MLRRVEPVYSLANKGECAVAEFITCGSLPRKITQADFKRQGPDFFFFWGRVSYILFTLYVRVLWHAYKGQRTNYWSQLSPSPMWVPGTELNLSGLAGRDFTRGSISLALMQRFCFNWAMVAGTIQKIC